jgi:hypothetical protein
MTASWINSATLWSQRPNFTFTLLSEGHAIHFSPLPVRHQRSRGQAFLKIKSVETKQSTAYRRQHHEEDRQNKQLEGQTWQERPYRQPRHGSSDRSWPEAGEEPYDFAYALSEQFRRVVANGGPLVRFA